MTRETSDSNVRLDGGVLEQEDSEYVELFWRFYKYPSQEYGPTYFVVSKAEDPPYDAVLGRKDSYKHGFRKGRGFRHRTKEEDKRK
jgi:hypothetical protein